MSARPSIRREFTRRDFLKMSGAGLAGASLLGSTACGDSTGGGPVELTFWSWVPGIKDEVQLYNDTHKNVTVKYVNAGQGAAEYTKLRTALKAEKGVPDVVQIEFQYIPTFTQIDALADISQYGANDVKNDYVDWTWSQVSEGDKVYAIPQDSGPMALLYRKDIFDKYDLKVPKTWDEFASEAKKLHEADPDTYMTNFAANDGGWLTGLMWQAGSRPFDVNGAKISINMNDQGAMQVANYWQGLIEDGTVSTDPDFTNDWYAGLGKGKYATWISAGWGPVFLKGVAGESKGKWRAAPLPQWKAGENVSANWGGSTSAVTAASEEPEAATEFAIWLNNNEKSVNMLTTESNLFPVQKSKLNSPDFVNARLAFAGGQKVNSVFIDASNNVDKGFEWSPFQDYVYAQLLEKVGDAAKGDTTFPEAMDKVQNSVTGYAKEQGFKVQ
jgi:multiple sugar transport system substrate-binding protein